MGGFGTWLSTNGLIRHRTRIVYRSYARGSVDADGQHALQTSSVRAGSLSALSSRRNRIRCVAFVRFIRDSWPLELSGARSPVRRAYGTVTHHARSRTHGTGLYLKVCLASRFRCVYRVRSVGKQERGPGHCAARNQEDSCPLCGATHQTSPESPDVVRHEIQYDSIKSEQCDPAYGHLGEHCHRGRYDGNGE